MTSGGGKLHLDSDSYYRICAFSAKMFCLNYFAFSPSAYSVYSVVKKMVPYFFSIGVVFIRGSPFLRRARFSI
jgi:hypothetical protein